MNGSRGPEKVTVTSTKPVATTVSTVPGNGRVKEDEAHRAAYDRSASTYTKPQSERFGG